MLSSAIRANEQAPQKSTRQWAKFGDCANAEGPERGITMNCDRRPVEFVFSDPVRDRTNTLEQISLMKTSWLRYRPPTLVGKSNGAGFANDTAKHILPDRHSPDDATSTSSKGQANSRAGKTWSPIEQKRRNEHQKPPGFSAPQALNKDETKKPPLKFGSTLHTDAAEFIPQSNASGPPQPVQWLNNDQLQKPHDQIEHPFTLPDKDASGKSHGPATEHGQMGGDAFSRQSRDNGPNGSRREMDPDARSEIARRNAQLLHMKSKLKEHYRLLYSKYKEYVGKRVPEKVEEYYMRLKHCQAQYMKLKYYEYKAAHLNTGKPNANSQPEPPSGGPGGPPGGRGGPLPGHVPGIPSRPGNDNSRIPIPDNNPWQSQLRVNAKQYSGIGAMQGNSMWGDGYARNSGPPGPQAGFDEYSKHRFDQQGSYNDGGRFSNSEPAHPYGAAEGNWNDSPARGNGYSRRDNSNQYQRGGDNQKHPFWNH